MKYNPQKTKGEPYVCKNGNSLDKPYSILHTKNKVSGHVTINNGERFPTNILRFNRDTDKFHPTQKPVDLIRYLVLTYTNEGDTVLDNCIGSGTTAIACIREKRHFIGFELNKEYYEKALKRIENEMRQLTLF